MLLQSLSEPGDNVGAQNLLAYIIAETQTAKRDTTPTIVNPNPKLVLKVLGIGHI
jgi:hypothetical protein